MPLHFAVQFRDGCPASSVALTPMDGEYVLVSNAYADDILGGMWSPPFQVEIGLYSAVGTDEEQERDRIDDDMKYKLCTCCDNSGTSRRFQ
tara:strand:+ start:80 stop:352 length:273 start_codon:yes stop_codon:yes gene_type:complete